MIAPKIYCLKYIVAMPDYKRPSADAMVEFFLTKKAALAREEELLLSYYDDNGLSEEEEENSEEGQDAHDAAEGGAEDNQDADGAAKEVEEENGATEKGETSTKFKRLKKLQKMMKNDDLADYIYNESYMQMDPLTCEIFEVEYED